jgi:hypothetical protein
LDFFVNRRKKNHPTEQKKSAKAGRYTWRLISVRYSCHDAAIELATKIYAIIRFWKKIHTKQTKKDLCFSELGECCAKVGEALLLNALQFALGHRGGVGNSLVQPEDLVLEGLQQTK